MIPTDWRRLGAIHAEDDGTLGAIWLACDPRTNVTHLYDCALFKTEVMAVIADGVSARGRWIPIAYRKDDEEFAKKLQNAGINMLPEPSSDKPAVVEVMSRDIWLRMRGSRFKVDETASQWLDEYRTFYRDESKVPSEGFPLMAATRHAIEQIHYAKPQSYPGSKRLNHPGIQPI